MPRKTSRARLANGLISAVIVVFFIAHAILGGLAGLFDLKSPFSQLIWIGVVLIGVHVIVSAVTSREQLSDPERPASKRKKRHLALKWATGGVLLALAATHVASMRLWGPSAVQSSASGAAISIALAAALATHLCVGSKSLLKDLGIDRRFQPAFRVAVCAVAACVALSAIIAVVL